MLRRSTAIAATVLGLTVLLPAHEAWAALSISVDPPATAGFGVTLDGTDQTADYTLPITVQDTGGPADGWRLLMRATQLTSAGDTLPAQSVTSVGWACQAACTIDPANSVATPVTLPFAVPAERFFNAAASTGIGTFTVTPTVTVAVPANAHPGSYTSTVTTLLIAGP
jgi:hypothetical protein